MTTSSKPTLDQLLDTIRRAYAERGVSISLSFLVSDQDQYLRYGGHLGVQLDPVPSESEIVATSANALGPDGSYFGHITVQSSIDKWRDEHPGNSSRWDVV